MGKNEYDLLKEILDKVNSLESRVNEIEVDKLSKKEIVPVDNKPVFHSLALEEKQEKQENKESNPSLDRTTDLVIEYFSKVPPKRKFE
jgi:hypothetical protein